MHPISFQQVARMAEGLLLQGDPAQTICSVHFDSRSLTEGSLFVAVQGGNRDGHDFLLQAAEQGASGALITDESKIPAGLPASFGLILVNDSLRGFQKLSGSYRRQFTFPFIAVTGSNGKTTTKDIIAHVLSQQLATYKTYKNYNNHLGVPYSLLQLERELEVAVLELGMNHAGEIDLLASLVKPQISVITNISDAHIEHFGTKEKIALAKAELLSHTDPDGMVLLNGDNEYLRKISHLYDGKLLFYSVEGPADIWADEIEPTESGTRFTVHFRTGEHFPVFLSLHGRHNVSNALAAIAIGRHFGLAPETICEALKSVSISGMRFEVSPTAAGGVLINDAYNASPTSMKASIETFAGLFPERKRILVLGDMFELGEDSLKMHSEVGQFIDKYKADFHLLIAIGEASRFLCEAYTGEKRHFPTKEDALDSIKALNQPGNAILLKASRGMKFETLVEALKG
ncbi:UDP-N-acetylmuramoyl-tripeptide--D-alanyl-D-alanine ligase [Brevibacillus sp. B_LB10_24]|uniref:UDP-N-acetylmuramoyl-tripeptide--D-alanyl-D- alanine ligase n=1 Tax=Brevibacillus sp. B_LB10_24 TaxID=3380645 RepID=UPI0038BC2FFF